MKGFIALLLLAFLGATAWNAWQIRELKQEVASLQRMVQQQAAAQKAEARRTDDLLARANAALDEARQAIAHMDTARARSALDAATQRIADAARYANEKAAPTVHWLQQQAADIGKQVQERVNTKAR